MENNLAKLRRNAWAFHQERFEITTNPGELTLTEKATGEILLSAKVHGRDEIEVDGGRLFSAEGSRIEIEPEKLVVNERITLSRNTIRGMNSAFVIAKDVFTIGAGPGGPPKHLLDEAA